MIEKMKGCINDLEQIGREIYYAISFLPPNSPAIANLTQALNILGIKQPKDVGLGNSVLRKRA